MAVPYQQSECWDREGDIIILMYGVNTINHKCIVESCQTIHKWKKSVKILNK